MEEYLTLAKSLRPKHGGTWSLDPMDCKHQWQYPKGRVPALSSPPLQNGGMLITRPQTNVYSRPGHPYTTVCTETASIPVQATPIRAHRRCYRGMVVQPGSSVLQPSPLPGQARMRMPPAYACCGCRCLLQPFYRHERRNAVSVCCR